MCGIVGYIGDEDAVEILLDGLKRLEYRGYDSAGIATIKDGHINIRRIKGKISLLDRVLKKSPIYGKIGLGHTRWATHGRPSEENAHPHRDCTGSIVIVHNGIIENYLSLKEKLKKRGHRFKSETDTEIIAHLIEEYYYHVTPPAFCESKTGGQVHRRSDDLEKAVKRALREVEGSYALGIMSSREPDKLIAARKGSPLIIGLSERTPSGKDGNYFIASDVPAILRYTKDIIYLEDGEMAILAKTGVRLYGQNGKLKELEKRIKKISWDVNMAEKEGYPHFMLKEIHEQPRAIEDTIRGRISLDGANIHLEEMGLCRDELKKINRIIITACGTSWHAGLVGEYLIEDLARIPVEVENSAEFRYRNPIVAKDTLVVAISQSGETADTLGAIREVHQKKGRVISICNVVGSSVVRESDSVIYTHAGPEIGVASTKAFTTQLTILYILAIYLGRIKGNLNTEQVKKMIAELRELPEKTKEMLKQENEVIKIANKFYNHRNAIYLGRGKGYPVALEGALKLKEVSYIHAEGYPAAEMKHGPIALIDKNMPVIVVALKGRRYDKIIANIEEVKARGGIVIALASIGDKKIREKVDEVIYVPEATIPLSPILAVIPLQLLAYYIAVKRGCNPDQPRHLAKSVTVE